MKYFIYLFYAQKSLSRRKGFKVMVGPTGFETIVF